MRCNAEKVSQSVEEIQRRSAGEPDSVQAQAALQAPVTLHLALVVPAKLYDPDQRLFTPVWATGYRYRCAPDAQDSGAAAAKLNSPQNTVYVEA